MRKIIILILTLASLKAFGQSEALNDLVRTNPPSSTKTANALDASASYGTSGTNTYAISPGLGQYSGGLTYASGDMFTITIGNANSSTTVTLNVDSEGAVALKNNDGTDPEIGSLCAGCTFKFRHNGTNFRMVGSSGGGSGEIEVGTTEITSGTTTRVLYNNSGVVGEYPITGSTNVVMSNDPTLTNPIVGTQSANDNSTKAASTAYADAKVADAINNGTTTIAPSQNAVFDALALKADVGSAGHTIENSGTPLTTRANLNFKNGLTASDNTPDTDAKLGGALTEDTTISGDSLKFTNQGVIFDDNLLQGQGVKQWLVTNKPTPITFPVGVISPSTNNTNNYFALDIFPSGPIEPTTDYSGTEGIAWLDVCDKDLVTNPSAQTTYLHLAARAADNQISSKALNGATVKPLNLAIGSTTYLSVNTSGRVQFPFYTALDDQLSGALANTKYTFVGSGGGVVYQVPADKLKVTDPTTAADANLVTALGQMWKITGTSTLSGAATIAGGSIRNPLSYTGSWTANANNQYFSSDVATLTASSTVGDRLSIGRIGGSLTSGANNQILSGLLIENTFVNGGSHTGLSNNYLQVFGTNNLFSVSQSSSAFGNTTNTNSITINTSGSDLSIVGAGGNDLLLSHGTAISTTTGSGSVFGIGTYSGQTHAVIKQFSSGATTSTATQRSSCNLNLAMTEWTGAASQVNFWTNRATISSAVNQESFYDLYYGQSASSPSLANLYFRLKNNGDLLIGAGTTTSLTPSARLHVRGSGTGSGATFLSEASDGTDRFSILDDGRTFGTALHNNAGAVTGTTNQYIASGTYTPTLTNVTNISASTAYECQWIRVGNVVTVSGKVDIDVTIGAASELGVSLPIASGLTADENVGGTASSAAAASLVSAIRADATNDRAAFVFTAVSLTNDSYAFEFTYIIK